MKCPFCKGATRIKRKGDANITTPIRQRFCVDCGKVFTTQEKIHVSDESLNNIMFAKKRTGEIVEFNPGKITDAIFKAAKSVGGKNKRLSEDLTRLVLGELNKNFGGGKLPEVEDIQDTVEKVLIENGHYRTAKAYILFRQKRAEARETRSTLIDVEETIDGYLGRTDWRVKENSNEQFSFSGLLLYTSGRLLANHNLNHMYTPSIAEAHKKGEVHIHDLSYGVVAYCAGWSLKNLLLRGFGGVPGKVDCKPAKHMGTVVHQMVNFIGCLQMEFAGAQAFSSVDTFLAPFVKADEMTYKEVKQCVQQLVFSLNIPSRWGSQYPFSNLTFDWTVPEDMKEEKAIVGGKGQEFTYGDCQKEMDLINKAFLEVLIEGDAAGRIFSFPIPTYNLTKDFNWDSPNVELLFDLTAKYGTPYFQNYIGSNLNPNSVRAMCCRLNMDLTQLMNRPGGMWGAGDNTGSIGVMTINMNRIGYEATNEEVFFDILERRLNICRDALEIKRGVIEKNLENGLMPYTKTYLGHFMNHFSTVGLVGMHECCINFMGRGIETPEGKEFTIKVLNFMRDKLQRFQEETGNLYNLEATPAESTSYRLARLDRKYYPQVITSGDDVPYLTNSTYLPAEHTEDVFEAVSHQNDIQPLYTGGTMFHTFLGERVSSGESCKNLVKKIAENTRLPYFSITPTFSICADHGYINGEVYECPDCNKKTEVFSRIVGYYRPLRNWNEGKTAEYKNRREYAEPTTARPAVVESTRARSTGRKEGVA